MVELRPFDFALDPPLVPDDGSYSGSDGGSDDGSVNGSVNGSVDGSDDGSSRKIAADSLSRLTSRSRVKETVPVNPPPLMVRPWEGS